MARESCPDLVCHVERFRERRRGFADWNSGRQTVLISMVPRFTDVDTAEYIRDITRFAIPSADLDREWLRL
jgi:hypothetical protein